ncbi:hypothetical protein ABVK25_010960 [Lepraria finkii]|uniref:C2H2-type domain-containing protein n=1 Tax=Lepraria finkii TaxID=1340010 RepID=A0ABR4ASW0_9LECA
MAIISRHSNWTKIERKYKQDRRKKKYFHSKGSTRRTIESSPNRFQCNMSLRQRPAKTKRNEYACESCEARFEHSKQMSHHWHDIRASVPKLKHFGTVRVVAGIDGSLILKAR